MPATLRVSVQRALSLCSFDSTTYIQTLLHDIIMRRKDGLRIGSGFLLTEGELACASDPDECIGHGLKIGSVFGSTFQIFGAGHASLIFLSHRFLLAV